MRYVVTKWDEANKAVTVALADERRKPFSSAWAAHKAHHCVGSCFYCADERCPKFYPIPARKPSYFFVHPKGGKNRKQRRAGALVQHARPF